MLFILLTEYRGVVSQTDWSSLRYRDQYSFSYSRGTQPLHKGTNITDCLLHKDSRTLYYLFTKLLTIFEN